jgi:hypothetical protein
MTISGLEYNRAISVMQACVHGRSWRLKTPVTGGRKVKMSQSVGNDAALGLRGTVSLD